MFSGYNRLGGEVDELEPSVRNSGGWDNWQREPGDMTDLDFISIPFYSPDASYPDQRINNYDQPLEEHVTLNGPIAVRTIARQKGFIGQVGAPMANIAKGGGLKSYMQRLMARRRA